MSVQDNIKNICDKEQLVEYISSGCKPKKNWRIGTEHEKFAFDLQTLKPLPYHSSSGRADIRSLFEGLQA